MRQQSYLMVALAARLCCSCHYMIGWASEPVALGQDGRPYVVKSPKGIRPIPDRNLRFIVNRFPKRVEVIMTSDKWRIEGYGSGSSSELLIHSVAGVQDPKGSRRIISWDHPDGMNARIFLLGKGAGDRMEIH